MSNHVKIPELDVVRRRDEAIRRALNTPPAPAKSLVGKSTRTKNKSKKEAGAKSAPAKPKAT
jgi:hypothetical protein